jgi:PleD family two-component response regulator
MSLAPEKAYAGEDWQMPEMQQSEKLCYRLLIATDDSRTINNLKQIFHEDQFELAFASNGLEALQVVRTFKPHCILTKPYLSGMNGLMLTRMVKYNKRHKTIPVIMCLSGMTDSMRSELQKVGVDEILIQPIDYQSAVKAVINLVYSNLISMPREDEPAPAVQTESAADIVC